MGSSNRAQTGDGCIEVGQSAQAKLADLPATRVEYNQTDSEGNSWVGVLYLLCVKENALCYAFDFSSLEEQTDQLNHTLDSFRQHVAFSHPLL